MGPGERPVRGPGTRLGWERDRRPAPAASSEHAQRAAGRGVALLHQVAAHDRLPVGARPYGPEGTRSEQAATPDGAPHRVLQPDRRPGTRSVRRGRRDAARGGHRSRSEAGDWGSSSTRDGRPSTTRSCSTSPRSATAGVPSWPISARPIPAARGNSIRAASSCGSATRWPSCRRSTRARSTWSPRTRPTTCSSR